jgi:beta-galactosidase
VLCTPTATPPAWLTERHADISASMRSDSASVTAAGADTAPTPRPYRDLSRRIVERLAQEFGAASNVVGWQIDNEFWTASGEGVCLSACGVRIAPRDGC